MEDRLDLFTTPIVMCLLVQFAGGSQGDASAAFGLPVGHTTRVLGRFLDALHDRFAAVGHRLTHFGAARPQAVVGARDDWPFPSVDEWRPVALHCFVHRDASHFIQNAFIYGQALALMRFPQFVTRLAAPQHDGVERNAWLELRMDPMNALPMRLLEAPRLLARGIFVAALLASGGFASTLAMDYSARRDKRRVAEVYSVGGIDVIGWMFGKGHEAVQTRTLMVGASGAIFAAVGFNAAFAPRAETLLPALVLVINDVIAEVTRPKGELFTVQDVAHSGHLGGFAFGVALGGLLKTVERWRWQASFNAAFADDAQQRPPQDGLRLGGGSRILSWLRGWWTSPDRQGPRPPVGARSATAAPAAATAATRPQAVADRERMAAAAAARRTAST